MDLIDREALLQRLDYVCTGAGLWSNILQDAIEDCKEFIRHEDAVDAVPVVRCKDCKYRDAEITIPAPEESPYKSFIFASCPCKSFNIGDDFFCGKGKRKNDEHDEIEKNRRT